MEGTNGLSTDDLKTKPAGTETDVNKTSAAIPPPTFGFDEAGTFTLQIHSKAGFLSMIGFLQKSVFWMNERMEEYEKKLQEQKNILLKPTNKGMGRFNIFK